MGKDTLTVTDNRTGKTYELPIQYGTYPDNGATIRAMDLRQIKADDEDFGLLTYDPGFTNTCSCKSSITFIDGDKGILRYRGYAIDELARKSDFIEVAYLLIHGDLPTADELETWRWNITHRTFIHEKTKHFMNGFHHDAHPMGMFVGTVGALSTFYPDANMIFHEECRQKQLWRLIAKAGTMAAFAYRHNRGMPLVYPDNELSFAANFLSMMFKSTELKYQADPVLERALDTLFILHADHEQNCGTSAMRTIGSSHPDPYSAVAGAAAALYGPLHGGANEKVLRMLDSIGTVDKVAPFVEKVKSGEAGRLMGFGHRVYKNFDPRAVLIKELAHDVFQVTGTDPMLDVALELERIALQDDYFVSRKLYPNVDFYSGIIYRAMGFPVDMFPVLFAIGRIPGWLAQWQEMLLDSDQRITRPRQVYTGADTRDYVPMENR